MTTNRRQITERPRSKGEGAKRWKGMGKVPAKVKPFGKIYRWSCAAARREMKSVKELFLPKPAFPPWKSPLGANRAIQGKPVDHRLRIYLSVLLSSFPHSPCLSACPPSISCRRTFLFHPRHITLHLRPVLRCLSIRVGFRVLGNLSIPGVSALS